MEETSPRERYVARRVEKTMQQCVHFTGIQHGVCKAGVAYRSLSEVPCWSGERAKAICGKCTLPDRQSAEAIVRARLQEFEDGIRRTAEAMKAIERSGGCQPGQAGSTTCPTCKGTLNFSRSRINGHWIIQCSTDDCVSMIQ